MELYTSLAKQFFKSNYMPNIAQAYLPPGSSCYLGIFYNLDQNWELAVYSQFILSVIIVIMIGLIGFEIYGYRVALVALLIAKIYFSFIDYASYFLPETTFMFMMLITFCIFLRPIKTSNFFM